MIENTKKTSNRHWSLKEKARALRSQGLSYNEILVKVPVSKSTISLWCRDVKLTQKQAKRLSEKRDHSLKGIRAIQKMFWRRRCESFEQGVGMGRTKKDPRFIAGLMLYWAEGNKKLHCALANSDPRIIKFMVEWFYRYFGIAPQTITLHLHLHSGQDDNAMKRYWADLTGVPLENFMKSFVKSEGSGHRKNILYNGTVKVYPQGKSTYLLFTILGCIAGYLSQTIHEPIKIESWIPRLPYA